MYSAAAIAGASDVEPGDRTERSVEGEIGAGRHVGDLKQDAAADENRVRHGAPTRHYR